MNIALIAPDRPYLINQKSLPPLGCLYVADALKKLGHKVEVLDFADGYRFVDADVYGISITTPDYPTSLKILGWLRERGARRIVAGGPHVSLCPNECLEDGFDGAAIGDGELTMEPLLRSGRSYEEWARNIDDFYPDRNALDLWKYDFRVCGQRATPMMTARGCVWGKCAFCSRTNHSIRFCSAEHVKKEIDEICGLGFKAIQVYDDEFFMYPKRDTEIIRYMGEKDIIWRAFCHSRFILRNEQLVKEASENGLREVLIGIESGSGKILDAIHKGTTPRENAEAIKLFQKYGVRVKGAFIVGLPGESQDTLGETEKFIESNPCDDYDFSILQVLPGSSIFNNPDAYDLKFKSSYGWWKGIPGKYECSVSTSFLNSQDLITARQMLEDKFKKW